MLDAVQHRFLNSPRPASGSDEHDRTSFVAPTRPGYAQAFATRDAALAAQVMRRATTGPTRAIGLRSRRLGAHARHHAPGR